MCVARAISCFRVCERVKEGTMLCNLIVNQLSSEESVECAAVYSFILESEHVMIINGIECVGMGHNFKVC